MLKSMRLKNFKAYKDSGEIPLAPLTIIVGANNSGKSTLFHALLALVQTARDSDHGWAPRLVTKGLVDLNGYHDIVHGKVRAKSSFFEISLGLDGNIARPRSYVGDSNRSLGEFRVPDHADISFSLNEEIDEIAVNRSTLRMGDEPVISVERTNGHWSLVISPAHTPKDMDVDFSSVFPCIAIPAARIDRPSQEDIAAAHISSFCASVWTEILANKLDQIGPLRPHVPWHASIGARTSSSLGKGGENLVADMGSREKDLHTRKTRLEMVNEWLSKRRVLKGVHLQSDKMANGRSLVGDEWKGHANINIAAMGEGGSQILPIIAYARFGGSVDCLLVEQPEVHLHPALQAELADLFIDVVLTGRRQVLVETHSEHLLLRVRRRVAEGTLKPDDVAILFVEKHGPESRVRKLSLTDRGHFGDWPDGFFDEAYQEAMALATAAANNGR